MLAVAEGLGGFRVHVEDQAEALFGADLFDRASIVRIERPKAFGYGGFAHQFDELGFTADFERAGLGITVGFQEGVEVFLSLFEETNARGGRRAQRTIGGW